MRHNQHYEGNTLGAVRLAGFSAPLSETSLSFLRRGALQGWQKGARVVRVANSRDVHGLNALQWLNALENIYVAPGDDARLDAEAAAMVPRRRKDKSSLSEHRIVQRRAAKDPPDVQRRLLHEFRPALNLRLKVSCIRVRRRPHHRRSDDRAAPPCDVGYFEAIEEFRWPARR